MPSGVEAKGTEVEGGKAGAEQARVTSHHQRVFDAGVVGGWRVDVTMSSVTCCLPLVEVRHETIYC